MKEIGMKEKDMAKEHLLFMMAKNIKVNFKKEKWQILKDISMIVNNKAKIKIKYSKTNKTKK